MSRGLSGHVCTGFELSNSLLYKRFQEERLCILENKWYMSEKAGYDVGFERALLDWVFNYRQEWLASRK